jgi:hypothetical protein
LEREHIASENFDNPNIEKLLDHLVLQNAPNGVVCLPKLLKLLKDQGAAKGFIDEQKMDVNIQLVEQTCLRYSHGQLLNI